MYLPLMPTLSSPRPRAPRLAPRRTLLGVFLLVGGLVQPEGVSAQQPFQIETHATPTGPDDGVLLQRPATLRARTVYVQIRGDYTNDSLVVALRGSSVTEVSVLQHRLVGSVSVAYGVVDRLSLYMTLPLVLHQAGASVLGLPEPAARGFGDLTLGMHAQLFGGSEGAQLGVGLALVEPTGSVQAFASDDRIGGVVQLRFAYVGHRWSLGATTGVSLRPDREWLTHQTGADLTLVLGGFVHPAEGLRLGLELATATGLTDGAFFDRNRTPLEVDLSGRLTMDHGLFVQASAGLGFVNGVGNPRVRATLALGFTSAQIR
jgi:hypothetical protein